MPQVIWRAGLDLNPIDVSDVRQVRGLETLVWSGKEDRLTNLRAALSLARVDPPRVIAGDLRADRPATGGSNAHGCHGHGVAHRSARLCATHWSAPIL
jgi:hypothetical protein